MTLPEAVSSPERRTKSRDRLSFLAPHLALVVVQILLGTWPIVGKIALRVFPSAGLVMLRTTGAALAFLLLRKKFSLNPIQTRGDYLRLALYSILGISLNQLLFVKGLSYTTVINTTVLATLIPIFAMIASVALKRERASWLKSAGVILAAAGALYLINPLHGDFSVTNALGDLLIIGNCACYGSYIAFSKDVIKRYGTFTAIFWIFIFGSLGTVPFGMVSLAHFSWSALSTNAWLSLLYIVLGPTVIAYFLNAWALERVSPSIVAAYVYLQPLIAFMAAPLILGEKPNSRIWLAALLIFSGVGVVTQSDRLFRNAQPEIATAD